MNILYVVPHPPSLVRVRPYNLIRRLHARGHRITVATVWSTQEEYGDVEHLRAQGIEVMAKYLPKSQIARNLLRAVITGVPMQAAYCETPSLKTAIAATLGAPWTRFDAVHVEHLRAACYGLHIQSLISNTQYPPAVVWDSVDCISYLFAQAARNSRSLKGRLMTRLELARTRRYEARLVRQFDRVLVTSEADRQAFLALLREELRETREKGKKGKREMRGRTVTANTQSPISSTSTGLTTSLQSPISNLQSPISVLPNGVDLDYFTPTDEPREPATLVISGKMSYHANVTAVLHLVYDIMPHIWAKRPDVKLWIVGKDPPREIRRYAVRSTQYAVQVTGTVPDIRPYLRRATIAVAPVPYGAGIQNKVLEAMACGTPVVASSRATAALATQPGRDLVVAEGTEAFAQAILALLANTQRRALLGRAGRAYVEVHHTWDVVAARLEAIYEDTVTVAARPATGSGVLW